MLLLRGGVVGGGEVLSSPYFALYQHTSTAIAQFAAEASFDVALKGNKMALPTLMAASEEHGRPN